jgi:hypothetical protein
VALLKFSPDEIKLSQQDAFRILRFFLLEPGVLPQQLSAEDRGFAQALLVEAIDRSYDMGFVEILFKSFFMKIPTDFKAIQDMVKEFSKQAAKHWFKHATGADLRDPRIYESVRTSVARNFRTVWSTRVQTGEPVLY